MIDHKHKCIFIHIARTGGSSIESMMVGNDYWNINPNEKHLPAEVAKKLYSPYWHSYYKFSIVRNPFDRIRSAFKFADHYGLTLNSNGEIEMDTYKTLWNYPFLCEGNRFAPVKVYDPRNLNLKTGQLYGNLIGPGLDDVFLFEELDSVILDLREKYKNLYPLTYRHQASTKAWPKLSQKSIELIREIHHYDFETYGYSMDYSN